MNTIRALHLMLAAAIATPASAGSIANSGSSWNGSYGFLTSSDRAVGLSQAQAIRAARQANTASTVIYQTTNNTTTNTNTVGAMNTGDTSVTVTGDGNTLTTTSAADSTGCLDGSVGWTTAETGQTDATGSYYFSVTDASTAPTCQ
jgi:hypothetical protein